MIRLPDTALPPATDAALQALQAEIDALPTHEARVDAGRTRFRSRNRADDPVFRVVRRTLSGMCSGAQRCMYCEDSCADEVEHVRPKHLYPASVFAWSNYLYACGPCNGPKSSQFPLVVGGALARCTGVDAEGRAVPPPAGAPALIDPRQEDPGAFLWVDLLDTFRMAPRRGLDPIAELRARATVDVPSSGSPRRSARWPTRRSGTR